MPTTTTMPHQATANDTDSGASPTVAPAATPAKARPAPARASKPAKAAKPVKAAKAETPARPVTAAKPAARGHSKREKLVRDSFTIPKSEYEALVGLKRRAIGLAISVKKSELLRAGVKALAAMSDAAFQTALKRVPTLKTGRPTKQPRPDGAC